MSLQTFRDSVKQISPKWLQDTWGEKLLYTVCLQLDGLAEFARQAVRARMPGLGTPTALQYIGDDRLIGRGFQEPDGSYESRLTGAFTSWDYAGNPRAPMQQILGFISPSTAPIRTVFTNSDGIVAWSAWDTMVVNQDPTTPPVHQFIQPANWNWDGLTSIASVGWWHNRAWVIIFVGAPGSSGSFFTRRAKLGTPGMKLGDGNALGVAVPASQGRALRNIVNTFKSAESYVQWIVIAYASNQFDPNSPAGGGVNPDGTWRRWGVTVGGVRVPARSRQACYADGPL